MTNERLSRVQISLTDTILNTALHAAITTQLLISHFGAISSLGIKEGSKVEALNIGVETLLTPNIKGSEIERAQFRRLEICGFYSSF